MRVRRAIFPSTPSLPSMHGALTLYQRTDPHGAGQVASLARRLLHGRTVGRKLVVHRGFARRTRIVPCAMRVRLWWCQWQALPNHSMIVRCAVTRSLPSFCLDNLAHIVCLRLRSEFLCPLKQQVIVFIGHRAADMKPVWSTPSILSAV